MLCLTEDQMKMAVLEKLEEIEKRLSPGQTRLGITSRVILVYILANYLYFKTIVKSLVFHRIKTF